MSGGTPYIGSTISLLSKAEIRYEGILWSIDTKDSTVTLANVRSYGTEDRVVEKQVAPRSEVYEYIVFRGSDIKDLHVSKAPKVPETVNQDPSILQQGAVGSNFSQFPSAPPYAPSYPTHPYGYGYQQSPYSPVPRPGINTGRSASPAGVPLVHSRTPSPPQNVGSIGSGPQTKTHESETQTPSQKATQTGKQNRKPSSRKNSLDLKQSGASKQNDADKTENKQEEEESTKKSHEKSQRGGGQRNRGGNQQSGSRKAKPPTFNGEFDFETSNAKFDKEKIEQELKSELEKMKISSQDDEVIIEADVEVESPGTDVYYDKTKSFFDFICNDPMTGEPGKRSGSWQEERKQNVQTFGIAGSYGGRGYGRGWRGRWRGSGRGRGRGGRGGSWSRNGERGGYQEQNKTPNRGGYRGNRGGYQGNRGGYQGTRGGYQGNRGGWDNNSFSENRSPNVNRVRSDREENST